MTPGGFVILFFGLAAMVVGGLVAMGLLVNLALQWLVMVVLAVVFVLLFRKPILEKFASKKTSHKVDTMVGERAVASQDILPQDYGQVELRGTTWKARNIGNEIIPSGKFCRVESVSELELSVIVWH